MTQRSHVPRFGNWESEENVPYTAYFEKARKGRNGKMINPNDPQEYLDSSSDNGVPTQGPVGRGVSEEPVEQGAIRRAHDRQRSREDGDLRQFSDSPARQENRRAGTESVPQRYGGRGVNYNESNKRPGRPNAQSIGSDNSFEQSPLHHRAKTPGRNVGAPSPVWEGKGSYESSHGTPGRSRLRPKGDDSPDKGAAIPKFGDWDENNPASADGYTHIFNKVKEERQTGAGRVPGLPNESPYRTARRDSRSRIYSSCISCESSSLAQKTHG